MGALLLNVINPFWTPWTGWTVWGWGETYVTFWGGTDTKLFCCVTWTGGWLTTWVFTNLFCIKLYFISILLPPAGTKLMIDLFIVTTWLTWATGWGCEGV